MTNETDDKENWTHRTLLDMGVAPAIDRTAVLPYTDKEPGNLRKV